MRGATPLGPSNAAGWEERQPAVGSHPLPTVLLAADASNDALEASGAVPIYYYLPARPLLARDAADNPVFSLTLILSRSPHLETESVAPLIEHGILACTITLAMPDDAVQSLAAELQATLRPLFARDVAFTMAFGSDEAAEPAMHTSGQNARFSFTRTLDRTATLAVLAALDGMTPAAEARCACQVVYRAAPSIQTVRLTGTWSAIYDYIRSHTGATEEFSLTDLRTHFVAMVDTGIITATAAPLPDAVAKLDPATFFDDFVRVCSIILDRVTPELDSGDPRNRFALGQRPDEAFRFEVSDTTSTPTQASCSLDAPIEAIFGGALAGLDRDRFISLVAPTSQAGVTGLAPVPVKVRGHSRDARWRRDVGGQPPVQLAASGGAFRSLAATLRPQMMTQRPAEALIASDGVSGGAVNATGIRHWVVDDVILERPEVDLRRPLPIVDDPSAPFWHDRLDAGHLWYAPEFEILQPEPNADPAASPFLFSFIQQGVTADAKVGLNGTLRFTLRQKMPAATVAALQAQGSATADAVLPTNVTVSLAVPFRDQSGATRSQAFPAQVQQAGDTLTATVALLDDWVRLAYGALGQPGFQAQPATLNVTYCYEAYVSVSDTGFQVVYGGKVAVTPIVYAANHPQAIASQAYFDAHSVAYHLPLGTMAFAREAPSALAPARIALAGRASRSIGAGETLASATVATAVAVPVALTAAHPAIIARPGLESSAVLAGILHRVSYGVQTLVRQECPPASFPCTILGAFYRQAFSDGTDQAIGCEDALTLGQTTYRQYAEMPELQHPLYRVYRSLQQPGRFMVVPTTYRITRYAASDPAKAYRPAILVYSLLDANNPSDTKSLFTATLQPDIPPYAQRELRAKLAKWAQVPIISYPTEVESQVAYTWGIVGLLQGLPAVAKMDDSFQVTLATDLTNGVLLLRLLQTSGVYGTAVFTLPDGSSVQSGLALELTHIIGPWDTGPILVALQGTSATLTNEIKTDLAVSDLVVYNGPGAGQPVAVDATLPAGGSRDVPLPAAAAEAYPVYSAGAGSSETPGEVRVFAEDIQTNVIFLDLVNYANHGLRQLDIQARLKDIDGTFPVPLSQGQPVGSVDFILPLTTYLASQTLQFQVTKTMTDGTTVVTAWLEWDLAARGNVVSITWDIIQ